MEWPGGLYGLADKTGKILTPQKYGTISDFTNGIAVASLGRGGLGGCGIIDTKGNEIFPFKYRYIGGFSEGIAWVEHEGRIGLLIDNYFVQE